MGPQGNKAINEEVPPYRKPTNKYRRNDRVENHHLPTISITIQKRNINDVMTKTWFKERDFF